MGLGMGAVRSGRICMASEATSSLGLLLGNKPQWRSAALAHMGSDNICILPYELTAETIELAEVNAILPFQFSEYQVLRSSRTACGRSLVPRQAHVELADDKLLFNRWLIDNGFAANVPQMFGCDPPFPFIRKKRVDEWGKNAAIFLDDEDVARADCKILDDDYIMQEYIKGAEEYIAHTISMDGAIIYAATLKNTYESETFIKCKAEQPISVEILGKEVLPEILTILRLLDYSGAHVLTSSIRPEGQCFSK